jgi:hypothetical protein
LKNCNPNGERHEIHTITDDELYNHHRVGERKRRLEQQLRIARNRMRRYGRSRRGNRFVNGFKQTMPRFAPIGDTSISDFHIEIERLLIALGRHDEVAEMEVRRKQNYL